MKIEDMISKNRADCSGCSACANVCPQNCIAMLRDDEGFSYPKINHEICISCGKCEKVCPALNFKPAMPDKLPEVFAAIYPDEKVRRHSSSGGAFTALSELILNNGGIIFGAGFDKNWRVIHTSAENFDELENLRGSKYVQSQIGDIYKRVKVELENNRQVLFSGTPCQCAGLKSFLGKDYDNLLTVDIICYGTPPSPIWENYLEYVAMGHDIARINFKSKRHGWTNPHLEINFYDCGYYAKGGSSDIYFKNFYSRIMFRPSCHECKFKFPNGKSDVTIADAWGVQNFAPKMFDNRGTSLVIVHTDKGKNFLSKAKLAGQRVSFDVVAVHNPHALTSSVPDDRRNNFFDDLKKFPHLSISVMQKYFNQPPKSSGRNKRAEAMQKYGAIIRHLANLREKNILLITLTMDNNIRNILTQNILRDFKDSGVYSLQMLNDTKLNFVDCLHPIINYTVPANLENMAVLLKSFHITEIFIDGQINFNEGSKKFLEDSGLPIRKFEWRR